MEIPPVSVQLNKNDSEAFARFCGGWPQYLIRALPVIVKVVLLLVFVVAPIVLFYHLHNLDVLEGSQGLHEKRPPVPAPSRGSGWVLLIFAGIFLRLWYIQRRRTHPPVAWRSPPEKPLPSAYWISEQGLHQRSENSEGTLKWPGITRIGETDEHIFLMRAERTGIVIPKRSFPNPESAAAFASQARAYHAGSRAPSA